ncbi:DUF2442 domain-containing protein [Aerophototrophica crusticola]|uniref:DUF2442 domain-containing protein n=1 Tax=Aerophototrophica crusticola TaxID=1709002 RepID=A0A858R9V1_9PROT|nr:DUF2442 domain-containing protein [Rhodospirillaceae bacterium B3]
MPGLLKNRIVTAKPDPSTRTIALTWEDGSETAYDLSAAIAQGGVFAALHDPAIFSALAIGPRGRSLRWPGDVDIDADAIWFDAHPQDNPFTKPAAAE